MGFAVRVTFLLLTYFYYYYYYIGTAPLHATTGLERERRSRDRGGPGESFRKQKNRGEKPERKKKMIGDCLFIFFRVAHLVSFVLLSFLFSHGVCGD